MIYRFAVLAGLLVLLLVTWLLYLNPAVVPFRLGGDIEFSASLPFFLLVGAAAGAALTGIAVGLRLLTSTSSWRRRRRREKADRRWREGLAAWYRADDRLAEGRLQQALKFDEHHAEARLALVRLVADRDDFDRAAELLDAALVLQPDDIRFHEAKLDLLRRRGDHLRLAAHLLYLKTRYPGNRRFHAALARAFMDQGQWREAAGAWQETAALARRLKDRKLVDEAARRLTVSRWEWAAASRGGDAAGAVATLDQVLRDDAEFISAYLLKAEIVAAENGEKAVREAVAVLKAGYRRRPHAELLLAGQRLLAAAGTDGWKEVRKYYDKAISRAPEYWPARLLLAVFLLDHQQPEEAARQLEELEKRSLADAPVVRLVAGELAYQRSGELNRATDQVLMALGDTDRPPYVFACSSCGRYDRRWRARCPRCGSYDTSDLSSDVVALGAASRAVAET
ncbi:MAG: hypothetical protein JW781_11550 [Deltaproteobacteria bacterium]|nr:hypothetical protein [Candidatus Anaeroferrophillacea bacterium]